MDQMSFGDGEYASKRKRANARRSIDQVQIMPGRARTKKKLGSPPMPVS